jgi:hypothetical protein
VLYLIKSLQPILLLMTLSARAIKLVSVWKKRTYVTYMDLERQDCAARVIQKYFLKAYYNPQYKLFRSRFIRQCERIQNEY